MGTRLCGKVAVVTGAGSSGGIGDAIARRLATEGCQVIATDVNKQVLINRADDISTSSRAIVSRCQDVTREEEWRVLADYVDQEFGGIDILINNAGVLRLEHVEDIDLVSWQEVLDVNLTGTFLGIKHLAGSLRKRGGGAIINLSSVAGLRASPLSGAYSAAKGGVRLLTKSAAVDLAVDNIRVNSVHPGFIVTPMQAEVRRAYGEGAYSRAVDVIPLGRAGTGADVGGLVLFLASDDASYITGGEFVIDGGLSAK